MPVGKVSVDATFVQKDAADDSNAAEAGKTIKLQIGSRIVNVDNEAVIYDAAPVIRNDRTLVPIRIITEALGGKVDWNGAAKEVTLSINDKEIKMTIGKTLAKIWRCTCYHRRTYLRTRALRGGRAWRNRRLGRCNKDSDNHEN